MIRLDIQVRLAQGRRAEALSVIEDALDRPDAQRGRVNADGPRYAWPMLVAGARACAAAAAPPRRDSAAKGAGDA